MLLSHPACRLLLLFLRIKYPQNGSNPNQLWGWGHVRAPQIANRGIMPQQSFCPICPLVPQQCFFLFMLIIMKGVSVGESAWCAADLTIRTRGIFTFILNPETWEENEICTITLELHYNRKEITWFIWNQLYTEHVHDTKDETMTVLIQHLAHNCLA